MIFYLLEVIKNMVHDLLLLVVALEALLLVLELSGHELVVHEVLLVALELVQVRPAHRRVDLERVLLDLVVQQPHVELQPAVLHQRVVHVELLEGISNEFELVSWEYSVEFLK